MTGVAMGFSRPNINVEEVNLGEGGIEAAKARLDAAFSLYYQEIRRVVRHRGLESSLATEVVHDLYIQLSRRPERLEAKTSVGAFLKRAAINLGIDHMRRARFERHLFSGTEAEALAVPTEAAAPDYGLEVEARLAVLREAIAELPARRRAVFILHRLHRLEPDQIARKLNISQNMVDRHLRRALAHCLDRLLGLE